MKFPTWLILIPGGCILGGWAVLRFSRAAVTCLRGARLRAGRHDQLSRGQFGDAERAQWRHIVHGLTRSDDLDGFRALVAQYEQHLRGRNGGRP